MKLTAELIHAGKTRRGGWTKKQLEVLGLSWPPTEGWIEQLAGTDIDDAAYQAFVSAAEDGCELTKKRNAPGVIPIPEILSTMPFGKHKGTRLMEVPRDYLEWALSECDMDVTLTAAIWAVLNPNVDTWLAITDYATEHAKRYKTFQVERFIAQTRQMGVAWARFVLVRGIELASKVYRRRRQHTKEKCGKMESMETELDRRLSRDSD